MKWVKGKIIPHTQAEIEEKNARLSLEAAEKNANKYKSDRKEAYLSELGTWEDQLDLIYKELTTGSPVWSDKIADIKTRFPKPNKQG